VGELDLTEIFRKIVKASTAVVRKRQKVVDLG